MARFAGDLGDEQTVGISPGAILVHQARIEHGYVIGKLNSRKETGLRPMRRTCGCPWSACRVDIEVILDATQAGRPHCASPPAGS
jgi:hypothetical protein